MWTEQKCKAKQPDLLNYLQRDYLSTYLVAN